MRVLKLSNYHRRLIYRKTFTVSFNLRVYIQLQFLDNESTSPLESKTTLPACSSFPSYKKFFHFPRMLIAFFNTSSLNCLSCCFAICDPPSACFYCTMLMCIWNFLFWLVLFIFWHQLFSIIIAASVPARNAFLRESCGIPTKAPCTWHPFLSAMCA